MNTTIRINADNMPTGYLARAAAVETLYQVLYRGQGLEISFDRAAGDLADRDRGFCRQLVLLTLRRRGSLQKILKSLMNKPLSEGAEKIGLILETGLAQIIFLDIKPHAAVDTAVHQVKNALGPLTRLAGLVNAVLRRAAKMQQELKKEADNDPLTDLPDAARRRWSEYFGPQAVRGIALSLRDQPPLDITVKDPLKRDDIAAKLGALKVSKTSLRLAGGDISTLPGYKEGDWWVQDAAAALPASLMDIKPGDRVADLCAAPGGKTMQLASRGAHVTAIDRSGKRLARLRENLARTNLTAILLDISALDHTADTLSGALYDSILLDAPCSATGTFRRNPDNLWTKSDSDISRLVALQKKLLDHAVSLLKPGGQLIYCVCSLDRREGEDQWRDFLSRRQEMKPHPISALELGGENTPAAKYITKQGTLRTYPKGQAVQAENAAAHTEDGKTKKPEAPVRQKLSGVVPPADSFDGFFIARSVKV